MLLIHNHPYKAVILDTDGVITKTAQVHARAWKQMFDHFLEKEQGAAFRPFDIETDYRQYIDGKPRHDGIRSFLASRDISLQEGDPTDAPDKSTVYGLGTRKNEIFLYLLAKDGVAVYPDTLELLKKWKSEGIKLAAVSSSRNCRHILETAKLLHFFDALVDGVVSAEKGLKGKPAPDIFLTASKMLGVAGSETIIIEDAIAGISAGKKGKFGLVVGVARDGGAAALKDAGADLVVRNISMLDDLRTKRFSISYHGWVPAEQRLRESLCTLGNGYFATRGAAEENGKDEFNYPGTYLAGGYNRAESHIAGRLVENEDFVNFPNWLCLSFKPEGGDWLDLQHCKVLEYTQTLELRKGTLLRNFRVEDKQGRRTAIRSRRMVSMRDKHLAGLQWKFTAENWSGEVTIRTALDGRVINDGVARYSKLERHHLVPVQTKQVSTDSLLLVVQTKQSQISMAQAARTRIYRAAEQLAPEKDTSEQQAYIHQELRFRVAEGQSYLVEKIVAVYTSGDRAISETAHAAVQAIARAGRFVEMLEQQEQAYTRLWRRADIGVINGDRLQHLLRLHIFHVLQTVSLNTIGMDVGVPARGLHGEAYRGHIFWDELYIFPFLNLRFPEITRSLLMYRYYRLDEARYAAKQAGYKGAMFPWQSGSNGREESQVVHLNPKSGNWLPDHTHLQRHINAAIAYNIWNYYLATDDQQFLSAFGAEMFLSIASFWASKTLYKQEKERYEIHQVVGPDEYHTAYPNSKEPGLHNNAYTNVMAAWVLQKALEILDLIEKSRKRELLQGLGIDKQELELWKDISQKMYVPFMDGGIISQFDGYEALAEFPWEAYLEKYDNIERLDRILESEGDSVDNYKVSKQADVLMLFYLFSPQELQVILGSLGYDFTQELIGKNVDYYKSRTSHGSTLSRLVFSWVHSRYDKVKSWGNFERLLISDFKDIQGGTTSEGIHLGAMAGSLDLIQRCYGGLEVGEDALWIKPALPEPIRKINMRIQYRRHWIYLAIDYEMLRISFEEGWGNEVNIGVVDKIYAFKKGEIREFALKPDVKPLNRR